MLKKILWTLFVVILVGPAPSAVRAQGPGAANLGQGRPPGVVFPPPTVQGSRDQEKSRDDQNPWTNAHNLAHGISHSLPSSHGPNAGRAAGLHPPAVPPEAGVSASELRFTPPKVTPVMRQGGSAIARAFSRGNGGKILGGIGAALAAAFGAVFGRKKES
jgi:hypothetical protein